MDQNIESKNAIACFLMDDVVNNVSVFIDNDGTTSVATTVRSGVVHIYRHTLNGFVFLILIYFLCSFRILSKIVLKPSALAE